VCQEPLPKRLEINGKIFDLADIDRPDKPYIILESISKEKKVSKGIYLIKSIADDTIKLVSIGLILIVGARPSMRYPDF
jgi:hypothetical protein